MLFFLKELISIIETYPINASDIGLLCNDILLTPHCPEPAVYL